MVLHPSAVRALAAITSAALLLTPLAASGAGATVGTTDTPDPGATKGGAARVLLMRANRVESPTVVTTRSGLTLATWEAWSTDLLRMVLYGAVRGPDDDSWSAPRAISPPPEGGPGVLDHVSVEHRGQPMVIWRTYNGLVQWRRLQRDGTWGKPARIAQSDSSNQLRAASDRRGDLAVSFDQPDSDTWVIWHKPARGRWAQLPAVPDLRPAYGLVVDATRVAWSAPVPDPDVVTANVVFTWNVGDDDWSEDRVGPAPGRVGRPSSDYAPMELFLAENGAMGVTWSDEDQDGDVQGQFAYRGPDDTEFGDPYADPALDAYPEFDISGDGTVTGVGQGSGAREDAVLLVRRDPRDGTWSAPKEILRDRHLSYVSDIDVHPTGSSVVEVWSHGDAGDVIRLLPCLTDGSCERPASFVQNQIYDVDMTAGPDGSAAYVYTVSRDCEICEPGKIFARVVRP